MSTLNKPQASIRVRILQSSAFAVGANLVRQSIGIVSTLILARLLSPADYGIVASAMLIVHFFDVFAQTGSNQYVMSRTSINDQTLQTAWTLRLCIRLVLCAAIVIGSPWLASFFKLPELQPVLIAAAAIPVIDALQSPGLLLLRRDFQYRKIAMITVGSKLISFAVGVWIAVQFRSYWALVAGNLTLVAVFSAWSYRLHSTRPRLTLRGVADQWNFSRWMLARSVLGYSRSKIDNFIIARALGASDFGVYSLSKQLATLPHVQITDSLSDIFLSSLAGSQSRRDDATRSFSRILVLLGSLMLPMAVGLGLFAKDFVPVLLGSTWHNAIPVIEMLAVLTLTFSLSSTCNLALVALERVREAFVLDLITTLMVILLMVVTLFFSTDLVAFAAARSAAGILVVVLAYAVLSRAIRLPHRDIALSLLPALLASAGMAFVAHTAQRALTDLPPLFGMIISGLLATTSFLVLYVPLLAVMARRTPEMAFLMTLIRSGIIWVRDKGRTLLCRIAAS